MVDGIEREFAGRATVLRVEYLSDAGRELAARLDVNATPTVIVFGSDGRESSRFSDLDAERFRSAFRAATKPG